METTSTFGSACGLCGTVDEERAQLSVINGKTLKLLLLLLNIYMCIYIYNYLGLFGHVCQTSPCSTILLLYCGSVYLCSVHIKLI